MTLNSYLLKVQWCKLCPDWPQIQIFRWLGSQRMSTFYNSDKSNSEGEEINLGQNHSATQKKKNELKLPVCQYCKSNQCMHFVPVSVL